MCFPIVIEIRVCVLYDPITQNIVGIDVETLDREYSYTFILPNITSFNIF